MDDTLYMNSIVDYMANLPLDHDYIPMFNARNIVLCTGQGAWEEEMVRTTRIMKDIFAAKGIRATVDFWGYDVNHDWPWWQKQLPYFLDKVL
jgi:esterase/lipase superfamily enzyme